MNIKKTIVFMATILISGFAINALAMPMQNCAAYKNLPLSKKNQITQITDEYNKIIMPIRKDLHASIIALQTELAKPQINEQAINALVTKVSGLRSQLFAESIQVKIQIIKTTGFNPAICEKPKQVTVHCIGNICKAPIIHRGPTAGLETAPRQGLHAAPHAGLQISKPPMQRKPVKPANETTESSLWQ